MTIRQRFATYMLAGALLTGGFTAVAVGTVGAAPATARSTAATTDPVATAARAALEALGTDGFAVRLETASYAAAVTVGADGAQMNRAWAAADQAHQVALLSALTQVGVPYRRNTSQAGVGFDCSGLTTYAWAQAGVGLYRQSGAQIKNAAARTRETAQAGDLAYYPGHVMMWLGVDSFIVHSPYSGRNVEVTTITHKRASRAKFGNPIG